MDIPQCTHTQETLTKNLSLVDLAKVQQRTQTAAPQGVGRGRRRPCPGTNGGDDDDDATETKIKAGADGALLGLGFGLCAYGCRHV